MSKQLWTAAALVILFGALMYSGISLLPYGGGDDAFLISPEFAKSYMEPFYNFEYFRLAASRTFLHIGYHLAYLAFGSNLGLAWFFFLGCYLLMALYFYTILKRFFSFEIAALASLFFLTYIGKEETLAQYQGQFYHVVIFLCLLGIDVFSRLHKRPAIAYSIIGLLLWISLHFYEVLIFTCLLFPIIQLFLNRGSPGKERDNRAMLFSFIPLIFCSLHILVLLQAAQPIWNRIPTQSNATIFDHAMRIPQVLKWGVNATMGPRYFWFLSHGFKGFFIHNLVEFPHHIWTLASAVLISILSFFKRNSHPAETKESKSPLDFSFTITLCLFVLFFAPLVALTIADGYIAPRFTYVGSVAATFAIALVLQRLKSSQKLYFWAKVATLSLVTIQATAYAGLFSQYRRAAELDRSIHKELSRELPKLQEGEKIFTIIPFDENSHYWSPNNIVGARYANSGSATFIWAANSHLENDVEYNVIVRRPGWIERLLSQESKLKTSLSSSFCFYFSDSGAIPLNEVILKRASMRVNSIIPCKKPLNLMSASTLLIEEDGERRESRIKTKVMELKSTNSN